MDHRMVDEDSRVSKHEYDPLNSGSSFDSAKSSTVTAVSAGNAGNANVAGGTASALGSATTRTAATGTKAAPNTVLQATPSTGFSLGGSSRGATPSTRTSVTSTGGFSSAAAAPAEVFKLGGTPSLGVAAPTTVTTAGTTTTASAPSSLASILKPKGTAAPSTSKPAGLSLGLSRNNTVAMEKDKSLVFFDRKSNQTGQRRNRRKKRKTEGGSRNEAQIHRPDGPFPVQQHVEDNLDINDEAHTRSLEQLIAEVEEELKQLEPPQEVSAWEKRQAKAEENWKSIRPVVFQKIVESSAIPPSDTLCQICRQVPATLRCKDCLCRLMCAGCDTMEHSKNPFHMREMWVNGFFERITPSQTVFEGQVKNQDRYFPVKFPYKCVQCSADSFSTIPTDSAYIVFTFGGRVHLKKQTVVCNHCKLIAPNNEMEGIISYGFFPGNPKKVTSIFEVRLLEWIDLVLKNMPGSSISAIGKTLEDISIEDTSVNRETLKRALAEYRYSIREVELLQEMDWMKCPPCSIKQHSAHVDGNFKLYRYKKVKQGVQAPYFCGTFIDKSSDVEKHVNKIYESDKKGTTKNNNMCGKTTWKAARVHSTAPSKLDEVGLDVGGCRHCIAQKAINMFTGEKYAYPHYIQTHFLHPKGVQFLWLDIVCKYWPWAKQEKIEILDQRFGQAVTDMKPALSVMHAKAHSWDCEVLWGGRNQTGAAAGPGEEMEQCFSYLSRCGSSTKNMGKANREDTLTSHVLFWNQKKVEGMARLLCKRYDVAQQTISRTSNELQKLLSGIPGGQTHLPDWLKKIRTRAKETQSPAESETRESQLEKSQLEKYFLLKQQQLEFVPLQEYTTVSSEPISLLVGNTALYSEVCKFTGNICGIQTDVLEMEQELRAKYGVGEEELLKRGKIAAVDSMCSKLQDQIELSCQYYKQRSIEISKYADSCKARKSLRQKNREEKNKIEELVKKYNSLHCIHGGAPVSVDDVLAGNFQWQRVSNGNVPWKTKKAAVDKWMLLKRNREEVELLKDEMKNYLFFFNKVITLLKADTVQLDSDGLTQLEYTSWCDVDDDKETNWRYQIHNYKAAQLGLKAIKEKGVWRAKKLRLAGAVLFKRILAGDMIEPIDEDWTYEGEPSDSESDDSELP